MDRARRRRAGAAAGLLAALCPCAWALNPALDISQYAHNAWTTRSGYSLGNVYTIAQTADGYLLLGSEFGMFRFDGVRFVLWKPPASEYLRNGIFKLLATRDGTLWIGTFGGLATWSGDKLTVRPEMDGQVVGSLLEDREGTVWAGSWAGGTPPVRLCAFRSGSSQCYGADGIFGKAVSSLYEDRSGNLWAGTWTGLWRWMPGPPKRFATPPVEITAVSEADNGRPVIASYGAGMMQLAGDKVESFPVRSAGNSNPLLREREIDSNKLLRDRDGGLWIGTVARGLLHIHNGRTDVFTRSDGLSGDIILSLFEDREGNVWVATTGGLDRFRELAVTTISVKQGLSSEAARAVLGTTDGSVWIATHDGLNRWKDGHAGVFRKSSGLPDDVTDSLFQDHSGRIWVSTPYGLAYLKDGRFVAAGAIPDGEVYSITGDDSSNLWLSEHQALLHLRDGRLVERFPWSDLGRTQQAKVVLFDRKHGGVWLSFWIGGGVLYFKDGQVRASYTAASGLGAGVVPDLKIDPDGALWAATYDGGLSRVQDGRIATLTTRNGLPCDTIHWAMEDDDGSLWLYASCGLVRIARTELDGWIADPNRRIQSALWDASDGLRLRSNAATGYGPPAAKSTDGRLWFVTGEGVQVVDPHHLADNPLPPPVQIEQIIVDRKIYWRNLPGGAGLNRRLPPRIRDLQIEFTSLSLVAPEKVHFKYKLEGQDGDWNETINGRQAEYTNLAPRQYRFRVIASNNSGVWNEGGDTLEFSIAPAYYQTSWFRALCVAALLAGIWALQRLRLYQIAREFNAQLDGRVDERLRVARDLHDTMLQTFQAALIQMQAGYNVLSRRPEKAAEAIQEAIAISARAIDEGREAIHNMRSSTEHANNLAQALRVAGDQMAAQGSAKFEVRVQGSSRDVHPILRDDVYRIALEALRNAFKHAEARAVEAEIVYGDSLRVRIRDDGKGIDEATLAEGRRSRHYGLPGIRERAERIGGKLEVWTAPGAGTEIQLSIPGTIAFGGSGAGWLFRRFRRKGKSKAAEA